MILFGKVNRKPESATENFDVQHDGLAVAIHESMVEFEEQIAGGLPVVLSNVYELWAVNQEKTPEQKTAVLEGVMSEAWGRIKDFFIRIWNKLKSWYESAIKYLGTIFSSNKKFIEKYGSELEAKTSSKFTYHGYKWADSMSGTWFAKTEKASGEAKKAFEEAVTAIGKSKDVSADNKAFKTDEKKKAIDSLIGAKGVSDFKTKMMKEIRGGGVKHDISGFSAVPVKKMIETITKESEAVSNIKEQLTKLQEDVNSYADAVDKCRTAAENDDATERANKMSYVTSAATVAKYHISYAVAALEVTKSAIKEQIGEFSGALRSFARHSVKKEDYEINGDGTVVTEGASLYETFMKDI